MLRVPLLAAIFLLPLVRAADTPQPAPAIGIFLDFDVTPAAAALETMKREVAHLVQPAGVALDWISRGGAAAQPLAGLIVLKFKGKCSVERWSQVADYPVPPRGTSTLAATFVADGAVKPFSEVKCDQLRTGLAYLPPETGHKEQQRALGLAMGRVVAHELYHILGHTTNHAAGGVAKATQNLKDLVSGVMSFEEKDARAIADGLRPAP